MAPWSIHAVWGLRLNACRLSYLATRCGRAYAGVTGCPFS